jgi:hypothetical protein
MGSIAGRGELSAQIRGNNGKLSCDLAMATMEEAAGLGTKLREPDHVVYALQEVSKTVSKGAQNGSHVPEMSAVLYIVARQIAEG